MEAHNHERTGPAMSDVKTYTGGVGCLIEGSWGHYGAIRVIEIARDYGYGPWGQLPAGMPETLEPTYRDAPHDALTWLMEKYRTEPDAEVEPGYTVAEAIIDDADAAEQWLNDVVAGEGFSFGWNDGEFFYQSDEWWEEVA